MLRRSDVLICSPNRMTDATVDRTMAAAAEKPFMMLSVYFTTTDVYRPPTLAKTGGANSKVGYHMDEEAPQAGNTL